MLQPINYLNYRLYEEAERNTDTQEELEEMVEIMIDELVKIARNNVE